MHKKLATKWKSFGFLRKVNISIQLSASFAIPQFHCQLHGRGSVLLPQRWHSWRFGKRRFGDVVLQELAEVTSFRVLAHHVDRLAHEADAQHPHQVRVAQARQDSGFVLKVRSGMFLIGSVKLLARALFELNNALL